MNRAKISISGPNFPAQHSFALHFSMQLRKLEGETVASRRLYCVIRDRGQCNTYVKRSTLKFGK
jgi:hypothetical protein